MNDLPVWFEVGTFVVLGVILVADLLLVVKRPHEPSVRESSLWVSFYVGLAIVFAILMFNFTGPQYGQEFVAGWLTEYSLSIDNLFIFILIMTRFKVPRRYQQEVLMIGILIALVLRGIFIALGAVVIEHFSPIFYIFGLFLLWTAWHQMRSEEESEHVGDNTVVRWARRVLPISDSYEGGRFRTTVNGKKMFTPLIVVILALGMTDLMFAIDSIPAIFGLTQQWFIVLTANIFALMGLRQLYFLLGGLLTRLIYLKYALSFILAFIGVKLIIQAMHENELPFLNGGEPITFLPKIETTFSLAVIASAILIATVASLIVSRRRERQSDAIDANNGDS